MMPEMKNSENRFLKIIKNNSDKPIHKTSLSATTSLSPQTSSSHSSAKSSFPSRKRLRFITISSRSSNSRKPSPSSSPTSSTVTLPSSTSPPLLKSSSASPPLFKSPLSTTVQTSCTTAINTAVNKTSCHRHKSTEATRLKSDKTRINYKKEEQTNNQNFSRNSIDCDASKSARLFLETNSKEMEVNESDSEKNSPNEPANDLLPTKRDEIEAGNLELVDENNPIVANNISTPKPVDKTIKCKNEDNDDDDDDGYDDDLCTEGTDTIVDGEEVKCKKRKYDSDGCNEICQSDLKKEETNEMNSEGLQYESYDKETKQISKLQWEIPFRQAKLNFESTNDIHTRIISDDHKFNHVTDLHNTGYRLNDLKIEYEKVVTSICKAETMLRIINKKIGAFKFKKNQLEDLFKKFNPGLKTKNFMLDELEDQNGNNIENFFNIGDLRSNKLKKNCFRSKNLNEKLKNKELDCESPTEELQTSDEKSVYPSPAHQHKFKMELFVNKELIGCLPPEAHLCKTDLSACTYLVCRRKVAD